MPLKDPDDFIPNEGSKYEPEEPGKQYEDPDFDVTTGEELVERLPDEGEIPQELAKTFWALVLLCNVALFAISLGAMLWYFWGWTERGGLMVLVGLIAAGSAAARYWRYQREHGDTSWSERLGEE